MNTRAIVLLVCLLASAPPRSDAAETSTSPRTDAAGDPLPPSAVARLGTLRWAHGTEVDYTAYLPDGREVLTVDNAGLFRIWEKETGKLSRRFGPSDCKQVYWHVYEANENKRKISKAGNPSPKHAVAVSADGKTVAIAHGDGILSLWDIASGKKLRLSRRTWRQRLRSRLTANRCSLGASISSFGNTSVSRGKNCASSADLVLTRRSSISMTQAV